MNLPVRVLDSITKAGPEHEGTVVVSGSHGGIFAAATALVAGTAAAFFSDAGFGLDDAGVAGVEWLDRYEVPAGAVSHLSAPIGDGVAALRHGVLTVVNRTAAELGCHTGQTVGDAASLLANALSTASETSDDPLGPAGRSALHPRKQDLEALEARWVLRPGSDSARRCEVVGLDSVSLVTPHDSRSIVVTGSHGALLGGDVSTAMRTDARAAVFNDAGRGPDGRGTTRLPALASRGIPAVTVDAYSARIGDARSTYQTGIISVANEPAIVLGTRPGMTIPEFVALIDRDCVSSSLSTSIDS